MSYKHLLFTRESTVDKNIPDLLQILKARHYKLDIITSYNEAAPITFFDQVIREKDGLDDSSIKKYLEQTGAEAKDVLFIGSNSAEIQLATSAGIDCGLALWTSVSIRHIRATYYLNTPQDILSLLNKNQTIDEKKPWLSWAMELQAIAQAGLTYSKDRFDLERFARIREISAAILSLKSGFSAEHVQDIFCNETGYQTPKIDTRAAIFKADKILLVKERTGTWSLPGGWVDVDQSVKSNVVKEVKEESGLDVVPLRLLAVQDRNAHNLPIYAYGVCKIFVQCEGIGGSFEPNIETVENRYFASDELPPLSEEKNNREQIQLCFTASRDKDWQVPFD
ncbi:MAG: NUDIX hydrolase N-terminal domain-containing protein [Sporolactobacillus sp.]